MKSTTPFILSLVLCLAAGAEHHAKHLFILSGQSNMQGAGQVEMKENSRNGGKGTLAYLVKNEKTAKKYAHLVNKKGEWITRKDVWIRYDDRQDGLRPGFGFRNTSIGPELGFGAVVGDAIDEPVLLIKTCWGGKNVMVDFRSPSGGMPPKALMERMLAGKKKREPDATMKAVEDVLASRTLGQLLRYVHVGLVVGVKDADAARAAVATQAALAAAGATGVPPPLPIHPGLAADDPTVRAAAVAVLGHDNDSFKNAYSFGKSCIL